MNLIQKNSSCLASAPSSCSAYFGSQNVGKALLEHLEEPAEKAYRCEMYAKLLFTSLPADMSLLSIDSYGTPVRLMSLPITSHRTTMIPQGPKKRIHLYQSCSSKHSGLRSAPIMHKKPSTTHFMTLSWMPEHLKSSTIPKSVLVLGCLQETIAKLKKSWMR